MKTSQKTSISLYWAILFSAIFLFESCRTSNLITSSGVSLTDSDSVIATIDSGKLYTIKKIIPNGNSYIIDVIQNDTTYRVLTKRNFFMGIIPTSKKVEIEVGKSYRLDIEQFCPKKCSESLYLEIGGIEFNGSMIPLRWGDILYTTKSLDGLEIVRDSTK